MTAERYAWTDLQVYVPARAPPAASERQMEPVGATLIRGQGTMKRWDGQVRKAEVPLGGTGLAAADVVGAEVDRWLECGLVGPARQDRRRVVGSTHG